MSLPLLSTSGFPIKIMIRKALSPLRHVCSEISVQWSRRIESTPVQSNTIIHQLEISPLILPSILV